MKFIENEIEPGHHIGQPRVSLGESTSTQYRHLLASLNLLETQSMSIKSPCAASQHRCSQTCRKPRSCASRQSSPWVDADSGIPAARCRRAHGIPCLYRKVALDPWADW